MKIEDTFTHIGKLSELRLSAYVISKMHTCSEFAQHFSSNINKQTDIVNCLNSQLQQFQCPGYKKKRYRPRKKHRLFIPKLNWAGLNISRYEQETNTNEGKWFVVSPTIFTRMAHDMAWLHVSNISLRHVKRSCHRAHLHFLLWRYTKLFTHWFTHVHARVHNFVFTAFCIHSFPYDALSN